MKQEHSWEITDAFWNAAEPLLPHRERDSNRDYQRKPGGGRPPMSPRKVLETIFFVLRTGISGSGAKRGFFRRYGRPGLRHTGKLRAFNGHG
jgi:transposase